MDSNLPIRRVTSGDNLSYQDFYNHVMKRNEPCLFDSFLTEPWSCRTLWVNRKEDSINFDFLEHTYANYEVPVSNCQEKYYNSHKTSEMTFSAFVKYWKEVINSKYDYSSQPCWYLKDWHFFLDVSLTDPPVYQVPQYFQDDWLNQHWLKDASTQDPMSDYRFVYMGPKGSSTPLHKDVYSSFSWSANIVGEKEWILIHPDKETLLRTKYGSGRQLPFDIEPLLDDPDFVCEVQPSKVVQKSGEVLFVPSDWIHQVKNTKDTISINHNWFNACNLSQVWRGLLQAFRDVQLELSDLTMKSAEWSQECQKLLRIHHGMNFQDLIEILQTQVKRLNLAHCSNFRVQHERSVLKGFLPLLQKELESSVNSEDLENRVHELIVKVS